MKPDFKNQLAAPPSQFRRTATSTMYLARLSAFICVAMTVRQVGIAEAFAKLRTPCAKPPWQQEIHDQVLPSSPSRNGARAYFRAHLRAMVRVRQSWPISELTFAQWCACGNLVITNYYSINSTATVGAQNRSSHRALRTRSNRSIKTRYNRFCVVIENQALFQQPSLLCHLEYRMLQVDQA